MPERFELIKLYLGRYIRGLSSSKADSDVLPHASLLRRLSGQSRQLPAIAVAEDVTDELLTEVAQKTQGFSGRELAKLMASVQAAVYGRPPPLALDAELLRTIVTYKLAEHATKQRLMSGQ